MFCNFAQTKCSKIISLFFWFIFGLFFLLIILINLFRLPFTCTCTKVCLFSSTPNLIPFQFFLFIHYCTRLNFVCMQHRAILVWWIRYRQLVLKGRSSNRLTPMVKLVKTIAQTKMQQVRTCPSAFCWTIVYTQKCPGMKIGLCS